jgi:hypothetical protein
MKALILAMTLFSLNASAWGPTGHRVVGEVAERFMDDSALIKAYKILNGPNLSRAANWPDEIKSEPQTYKYTYNWHHTDWKDEDHQHSENEISGKLITAIREQTAVLKDVNASNDKKAFAIKFLVHLIGDLHQPLHVGNGFDQGGNKCKVLFHKKEYTLHALWDEGMIDFTRLSFTELSSYVIQGRTRDQIIAWKKGDVLDWALESKNLRNLVYPADVVPSENQSTLKQYCRSDVVVTQELMPKLAYEYSYKFLPLVEQRLFQAGLRLAVVLNEALK